MRSASLGAAVVVFALGCTTTPSPNSSGSAGKMDRRAWLLHCVDRLRELRSAAGPAAVSASDELRVLAKELEDRLAASAVWFADATVLALRSNDAGRFGPRFWAAHIRAARSAAVDDGVVPLLVSLLTDETTPILQRTRAAELLGVMLHSAGASGGPAENRPEQLLAVLARVVESPDPVAAGVVVAHCREHARTSPAIGRYLTAVAEDTERPDPLRAAALGAAFGAADTRGASPAARRLRAFAREDPAPEVRATALGLVAPSLPEESDGLLTTSGAAGPGSHRVSPIHDRAALRKALRHPDPALRARGWVTVAMNAAPDRWERTRTLFRDEQDEMVLIAVLDAVGYAEWAFDQGDPALRFAQEMLLSGRSTLQRLAAAQALCHLVLHSHDGEPLLEQALQAWESVLASSREVRLRLADWITVNRAYLGSAYDGSIVQHLLRTLRE